MTENPKSEPAPNPAIGVLLITDDELHPDDSPGHDFTAAVATRAGVVVTLYDRSEETWGDSQHPEGPLRSGDDRLAERNHLLGQVQWFESRAITAQGWVSTLPSISAALTALAHVKADVVIVPASIQRKLLERALAGSSIAASLAEQIRRNPEIEASVWQVEDDGSAALVGDVA